MNWYKLSFGPVDSIAMTIAQMMVESYNGVMSGGLSKTKNIVMNIPDEQTLTDAINKATAIVATTLKLGEDVVSDERITSVIQELQSSFYAHQQTQQIEQNSAAKLQNVTNDLTENGDYHIEPLSPEPVEQSPQQNENLA